MHDTNVIQTAIPGVLVFQPRRIEDDRGFFIEAFRGDERTELGLQHDFVQDNWSRSQHRVLRGLHLQNPNPQGKLITVIQGTILDVAVDVRVGSATFGRHVAVELSDADGRQLFIPRGFAHGFVVLSPSADVYYKCDNFYDPGSEITIRWDDPDLAIDWRIETPKLSRRDARGRMLKDVVGLPQFEK